MHFANAQLVDLAQEKQWEQAACEEDEVGSLLLTATHSQHGLGITKHTYAKGDIQNKVTPLGSWCYTTQVSGARSYFALFSQRWLAFHQYSQFILIP